MRTVNPIEHLKQRNKILDAACSLFAKHGFSETSLDAVATACKMKKPSLYHYFKGKEDLLKELIRRKMAEVHGDMAKFHENLAKPPALRDVLLAMAQNFLKDITLKRNRDFMNLMMRQSGSDDRIRKIFTQELLNHTNRMHGEQLSICAMSTREGRLFMYQFMGSLIRYATEKKIWRTGMALEFKDEEYVVSLADVFSKGAPFKTC
jgi:AcrR family transcriptional regulator